MERRLNRLPKGEIVPPDLRRDDLRQEVNYRTHRAGYTTREGLPRPRRKMVTVAWGQGKLNVWPRDKAGRLKD